MSDIKGLNFVRDGTVSKNAKYFWSTILHLLSHRLSLGFLIQYLVLLLSLRGEPFSSVHISNEVETEPVENLHEGKQAEPEEKSKETANRGNVIHQTHLQSPLVFYKRLHGK